MQQNWQNLLIVKLTVYIIEEDIRVHSQQGKKVTQIIPSQPSIRCSCHCYGLQTYHNFQQLGWHH